MIEALTEGDRMMFKDIRRPKRGQDFKERSDL